MSFTRSGLFAFVLATAAVGCRNDNRSDNLEPPAPATKSVENPSVDTTVTQPAGTSATAEPGGGATMSGTVDRNDTSDTSGVTGGGTLNSDTVNQNANTAPGDAGVTDQNKAARRGTTTGPAPSAQTPPVDDQTSPSDEQTSPSDGQPPPATSDTATGTGTTNSGTNTENAGTGGGASTQPPR